MWQSKSNLDLMFLSRWSCLMGPVAKSDSFILIWSMALPVLSSIAMSTVLLAMEARGPSISVVKCSWV